VRRRKEEAARTARRVEARREGSGNASLSGRELDTEDVLASKAWIDAIAVRLRNAGLEGSLRDLRVLVYLDVTQGRDPLSRIVPRPGGSPGPGPGGDDPDMDTGPGDGDGGDDPDMDAGPGDADEDDGDDDEDDDEGDGGGPGGPRRGPGTPAGGLAPLPALLHLTFSADTLLGLSGTPAEAGGWAGLLDPDSLRRLVQAASRHPRSRWCVTVTGDDGEAIAHGCARGRHPWDPGPQARDGPAAGEATDQLADLLRQLKVKLAPIAKGACDHRRREEKYTPSRKLKHLVRARTARCAAPGCGARAEHCDLDHSVPWPHGPTCECDLGPVCRRHHRTKQSPGWALGQPEPGVMRWHTPAGRTYTTRPTRYDT
jgi:hypothetical protein